MAKTKTTDILGKIVEMLNPLSSEERNRVVRASLVLLGEKETNIVENNSGGNDVGGEEFLVLPDRAKTWIKKNRLSLNQIQQVFNIAKGEVEVIADMPGKDKTAKTLHAYILTGLASLLSTGVQNFYDKSARELCKTSGCYDGPNHITILKKKGNEFTGNKNKGWILTAPGLKRGAELVKELSGKHGD